MSCRGRNTLALSRGDGRLRGEHLQEAAESLLHTTFDSPSSASHSKLPELLDASATLITKLVI